MNKPAQSLTCQVLAWVLYLYSNSCYKLHPPFFSWRFVLAWAHCLVCKATVNSRLFIKRAKQLKYKASFIQSLLFFSHVKLRQLKYFKDFVKRKTTSIQIHNIESV